MKNSQLWLLCCFLLQSCNDQGESLLQYFNTGNLPATYFTIDTNRDTLLTTARGAVIRIPKGAIKGKSSQVRLAIKEAYDASEIMLAGLHTRSNGKLLSSGGMISIQAADGDAEIVQPVGVSLPSNNYEADMKLFRGEWDKDSMINWTDPQPLIPNQPLIDRLARGKMVFNTNCASCHHPTKDATGPPLVFLSQRRSKEWTLGFIYNSAAMIASGDPLANCIYNKWNKTAMTAFPTLTYEELDDMFRYLDQVSKNLNPADYPDVAAGLDSCRAYYNARAALERRRNAQIEDNGPEMKHVFLDTGTHPFDAPENLVAPKRANSVQYSFSITTFGWYNIDAFAMNLPGFEPASLKVSLTGAHTGHTNIWLVIPSAKVCVDGGLLKGEDKVYGFYTDDGQLSLPLGKQAYVLAFTEKDGQILFGRTAFTTAKNNELQLVPAPASRENMKQMIDYMDLQDLSVTVAPAKNIDTLQRIEAQLKAIEQLKPKGQRCDCLPYDPAAYTNAAGNAF